MNQLGSERNTENVQYIKVHPLSASTGIKVAATSNEAGTQRPDSQSGGRNLSSPARTAGSPRPKKTHDLMASVAVGLGIEPKLCTLVYWICILKMIICALLLLSSLNKHVDCQRDTRKQGDPTLYTHTHYICIYC